MIIWLASYPRSGNTFFRVLLNAAFGLKTYSIYNDRFDIGADSATSEVVGHEFLPDGFDIEDARAAEALYVIKTHELPSTIPGIDADRVIYLIRDGRDSCLSYFNYIRDFHPTQRKSFLDVIHGNVFAESWSGHVAAWGPRERKNTLVVHFEELVTKPVEMLGCIADFLNMRMLGQVIPSFEALHATNSKFFRKGRISAWAGSLSEAEHNLFWAFHGGPMLEYGYDSGMPDIWKHAENADLIRSMIRMEAEYRQSRPDSDILPVDDSSSDQTDVQSLIGLGEQAFQEGDFEQAISLFEMALQVDSSHPDLLNNLAVAHWQAGNASRAIDCLADAIEADPFNQTLILNGCRILLTYGCHAEARHLCESYLAAKPGDHDVISMMSELDLGASHANSDDQINVEGDESNHDDTIQKNTSEVHQGSSDVHPRKQRDTRVDAGEAAFLGGNVEHALELFEQALSENGTDVELLNNLMVCHWHLGNVERALECLLSALREDPDHRATIVNGVHVLAGLDQLEEAKALCARYLSTHPEDDAVQDALRALNDDACRIPKPEAAGQHAQPSGRTVAKNAGVQVVDFSATGVGALKISIVIPSFNQGRYLEQTLRSVFDQNYPNLEVIVMDGGSTDNSVDIIKKYEDRIDYWQSEPDAGQYWAINEGFLRSTGEIMTWINSDDKLHPGSFNVIASAFSQLRNVDWITGIPNVMNEDGVLQWVCNPLPVFSRSNYLNKRYDYPSFIQQEGTFWRRSLWEKAGGTLRTDLQMAGDLELWARFFRYAPLHTIDTFTGCFRQQREQKTAKAMSLYREEADRILDEEILRSRTSGVMVIPPVTPIRLARRQSEEGDRESELEKSIRTVLSVPSRRVSGMLPMAELGTKADPRSAMHGAHNRPLVTAIVSTYNSERFIRGCIEDLEAQTLASRLEIIVVDSGSEQDEGVVIRELQKRYHNIKYVRTEERETIYSAWNRGLQIARGKYITNANTDDRHRADALERMVDALDRNPDVVLVYADVAVTKAENSTFGNAVVDGYFRWPEFDANNLFAVCYVGPQPMWRAEVHQRYGYFDPTFRVAGDYEFWLRLAGSERFMHIPDVLGLYLNSAESIEHAFAGVGAQESEVARQRHWPHARGQRPPLREGYLVPAGGEFTPVPHPTLDRTMVDMSDDMPLVSVVMATKDRKELLSHALMSLAAQTYTNWEAVVVNDGGVDVSEVISRTCSAGNVRYISLATSGGQAKARNHALRDVRGEIICFLDDDDMYLPEHLEVIVDAFRVAERDVVYTDADLVIETMKNGKRQEVGRRIKPYEHGSFSRARLYADNYIPINTWAIRMHCFHGAGLFDEAMTCCEDWEFLLRLSRRYDFTHIEKTTVEVRHRADVIDNVTRLRINETVDAYRHIYATYTDMDSDRSVREGRERALDGLHEKLLALGQVPDKSLSGAARDRAPSVGDQIGCSLDYVREMKLFDVRCEQSGFKVPDILAVVIADSADDAKSLSITISSLQEQLYGCWTATVILPAQFPPADVPRADRVSYLYANTGDGALREIVEKSRAPWLAIIEAGDVIKATAFMRAVDYINLRPGWKFIYVDELRKTGAAVDPVYKPDFNREYFYAMNYVSGLSFVAREAMDLSGLLSACADDLAYEACLRALETHGESAIGHIAESLVVRREHNDCDEVRHSGVNGQISLVKAHFDRCGVSAVAQIGSLPGTVLVEYARRTDPEVTVVIYAGVDAANLSIVIQSLLEKTSYPAYSIRIGVHAGTDISSFDHVSLRFDLLPDEGRREDYFDRMARDVDSEYLVFMDSSVVALHQGWLDRLLSYTQRSAVMAVGARLISRDGRVVHGGLITGLGGLAVACVAHEGLAVSDPGYMQRAQCPQNLSAVSSACLLVRRDAYLKAGGFDKKVSVRLYQDVDFCQRLRALGGEIVWSPHVTLLYLGNDLETHRGRDARAVAMADAESILLRWLPQIARDPAYNPNFDRKSCAFARQNDSSLPWNPDIRDMPRVLGIGAGSYGSWQYRVAQPLTALSDAGSMRCSNTPFSNTALALPTVSELELMNPDVLLMHNTLHDAHIGAIQAYRRHNKLTLMFGQDDLMFALPPSNPFAKTIYKDIRKRLRRCLDLADGVVVTTEPLAEALRSMSGDVRVVPNYLPRSIWGGLKSARRQGARPRVGWAGAQQHGGDLALISDVVRQTAGEVDWIFFGMCPESIRPYVKEFYRGVPFSEYPAQLANLNLDLAIAPLERNRFNEAKSNLRILEYGFMGWPVIASDIHPYRDGPVCRVPNNVQAWVKTIRERVHDLDAAAREGDTLKAWVEDCWMLEDHLSGWFDALNPESPRAGLAASKADCVTG